MEDDNPRLQGRHLRSHRGRKARRARLIGGGILLAAILFGLGALDMMSEADRPAGPVGAPVPSRQEHAAAFAYGGSTFSGFVADSYGPRRADGPRVFYRWMDERLHATATRADARAPRSWAAWMEAERGRLRRQANPTRRAAAEQDVCAAVHKRIKAAIPRFSLDRGFEFTNTVSRGERQCFLQSVVIAGLLQSAGVDAGVVMVNRNIQGQYTNNGHAVTLVRLADGRGLLVDASEPKPFAEHQGLFAWDTRAHDYRYVVPVYAGAGPQIRSFRLAGSSASRTTAEITGLPLDFLRSQFEYYRGERTPGGPVAAKPTPAGLRDSERHLRASIRLCPENPLAVCMLGHVEHHLGDEEAALRTDSDARRLYARDGWMPDTLREARR